MSDEYSKEYYEAIDLEERPQAIAIAKKIEEFYKPESVIDFGCGTGLYIAQFTCPRRLGVDISTEAFKKGDGYALKETDLSKWQDYGRFDLGICFEVLEHIDEEHADMAIDNITKTVDTLVMTAALPGQPGLNHVNCQPQKYWEDKLVARGFTRNYLNEYWLAQTVSLVPHTMWMIKNLMVFESQYTKTTVSVTGK